MSPTRKVSQREAARPDVAHSQGRSLSAKPHAPMSPTRKEGLSARSRTPRRNAQSPRGGCILWRR
jgi:hypothetical protein